MASMAQGSTHTRTNEFPVGNIGFMVTREPRNPRRFITGSSAIRHNLEVRVGRSGETLPRPRHHRDAQFRRRKTPRHPARRVWVEETRPRAEDAGFVLHSGGWEKGKRGAELK